MNGGKKKYGVYGGTFDPLHKGHLKIIKESIIQLGLDKLYVVVSGNSWMKDNRVVASKYQRQEMIEIALRNYKKVSLLKFEIEKDSPSYSYQTLEYLKNKSNNEFYFIIGADAALGMDKWLKPLNILSSSKIVCIPRDNISKKRVKEKLLGIYANAKIQFLKNISERISSTTIRNSFKRNEIEQQCLNKNVYTYIVKNKIYL